MSSRQQKPTCLATVHLDENIKASYEFLINGTATFDSNKNWLPDFGLHKPSIFHLGILATIIEPGTSATFDWPAEGFVKHSAPIVFDPSVRPSVMSDRNAYKYPS